VPFLSQGRGTAKVPAQTRKAPIQRGAGGQESETADEHEDER
jgi:hypothetical protein